ncbi:MAG: TonB-dependent receptor, partial [Lentimicrobiaceae bacterium]|nr:TonB-dependent receptor [Lentimicrobiaceae bacterium]
NMKKYEVDGGVGIVFARINVQGPIVKDKASFLFTARRTYIDALVQPFLDSSNPMKGLKFYFYDLNGKMNWKINDKHRIFLSGYYGTDIYGFKGDDIAMDARFYWGNGAGSFRWNYNINSKLFLNTSAMISDFYFNTDIASGDMYKLGMKSGIRDYSFNTELTYMPVAGNILKTGIDYTFHHLTPGNYEIQMGSDFNIPLPFVLNAHEFAAFVNDEIDLSDEIRLNVGLRYSYYEHTGPYTSYTPDNIGRIVDSTVYKLGDKVKSYQGLEPRVSLRFAVDKDLSIKASYTYNYQYLHQVALSSISLPTDEWILSSTDIKPQQGSQYSIGFYKNMKSNMYELSVEAYYKDMKNLTEYREGYSPFTIIMQTLDRQYTQGEGYSYGLEFLLNKTMGKLTGWLGYSLAWSKRQFAELNGGKEFYAKNDRRHDVSISLSYDILPNLTTSIVWVYATGNTMTVPIGFYFIDYQMITEYSSKNAYRVPPYHRMDISVNWIIRKTERSEHGLNFSVYNVYNRRNPFFISIGSSMNTDKMEIQNTAYQMSLFPILPSISWNFKFR